MATAVEFKGSNFQFNPPPGREHDVLPLRCFVNGHAIVTCWELSPEDLEEVKRTGKVFLSTLSGMTFFPTLVGSSEVIRGMIVDYGGATIPRQETEDAPA